ncbi:hypothetical protein SISNIDRAFT_395390, partial [Sistotremastrum niveocremeum HHB9708]
DDDLHHLIQDKTTALECLTTIRTHFGRSTMARRFKAREDFHHVVHDPSKSIDVYIAAVLTARSTLTNIGCTIDDTDVKDILLMNLHPSYHGIRTNILTSKKEPSLAEVKDTLSTSASAVSVLPSVKTEDSSTSVMPAAMAAYHHSSRSSRHPAPSSSSFGHRPSHDTPSPAPNIDAKGFRWCDPSHEGHCHRCGRAGHIAARCIYDMPQKIKDYVLATP